MNKFTALRYLIMALLSLFTVPNLWAEDSQAPAGDTTTKPQDTPKKSTEKYIVPKPQASRIEALEDSLKIKRLDHQIETLEANGESFLTLYRPSLTSSTQGCIILLHSDNEHPDWPDAIGPLRDAMPEHSWCTVSIEVPDIIKRAKPVKAPSPTADDTQPLNELPNQPMVFARIQATINKAQEEGVSQFTLLGYGTGASYALGFLSANKDAAEALVLIDIKSPPNLSDYEVAQQIRQVAQPILDYYVNKSGRDQFAIWRKQAASQRIEKKGDFIQIDALPDRVNGKKNKPLLIQRVRGFLKQNTSQINQRKALPSVKKGLFYQSPIND
ncbi:MAG: alpha/beta hydrolase family protein [Oceanospirillaceae bacterium]|nr:alpha/beta hydrolase family protein [Oceanospirillaceae bacterium]